jgi:hypothetical protein
LNSEAVNPPVKIEFMALTDTRNFTDRSPIMEGDIRIAITAIASRIFSKVFVLTYCSKY